MKKGLIMGGFDLLHHGHRLVLEKAKSQCDYLIIGLATDETIAADKGEGRPIVDMENRQKMLSALRYVDEVRPFNLQTQAQVVLEIMPHICFAGKGGNPRLQKILDEFLLGLKVQVLDAEVIHTSDLIRNIQGTVYDRV